jgi:glycosyltransferase involved in cell wall biosynthesis
MTVDAVGGVWRYAIDLAAALAPYGFKFILVGLGPRPSVRQTKEATKVALLHWLDEPLDWMARSDRELTQIGQKLERLAQHERADLLHLNLPSQAEGLVTQRPVLVMSHSCVGTWFSAVRHGDLPQEWQWHLRANRRGFDRADVVVAPSRTHAAMLEEVYGAIKNLYVVHNASRSDVTRDKKNQLVLAAGRWWDDGKNGSAIDEAAQAIAWPVVMAGPNSGPNGQRLEISHAQHRGELSHDDMMALMRRSAIFVSPSIYEPFGLAPLEAARAHAALVLADIPTYHELWMDAALFADPRDSRAIAAAVNLLIDDPELRGSFAHKAARRSRRFDPTSQAAAMASLYDDLFRRDTTFSAAG